MVQSVALEWGPRSVVIRAGHITQLGGHMLGLRLPEILVILLIVVVLFGAKRLPELATGIGKGIRNFKDASRGDGEDKEKA